MSTRSLNDQRHERRSIVVAGGNTRNMLAVSLLLRRFGYEVLTADTAAQAQEHLSGKQPALVISDLTLPDMHGVDFLQDHRQLKGAGAIPMIFMVFPGDSAAESRCMGYGAAGCISKPIQAEELYRTVQQAIEARPRTSIRIDTQLPVSVNNLAIENAGGGPDIDLSENGMYVPTANPYPANKQVSVQLHMKERTISTNGSIIYSRSGGGTRVVTPGMGLKFTAIAPQDRDFIRKYIHDEITRDLNAALSGAAPSPW